MILTKNDYKDFNEHNDGCTIDGKENISFEDKKKEAFEEAQEYVKNFDTIEDAWNEIRNDSECFTEEHGYVDTGNLYLGMAVLTAPRDEKHIYWDVRED